MKWSWHIGSFAGIGVYIHATFLLLLGWVGLVYWFQAGTIAAVVGGRHPEAGSERTGTSLSENNDGREGEAGTAFSCIR